MPIDVVEKYCATIIKGFQTKITIPGILIIDTPGHEVFSNLRVRGGSVSDISILVIDMMESVEKQTEECIDILRSRKTPFVVAANKVDKIPGWQSHPDKTIADSYKLQSPTVQERFDQRLYTIVRDLSKFGFSSDRYDRIRDFTKSAAIVPTSAVTGEGIPELLALICGLVQQYIVKRLGVTDGPGKGVVLETKEEPGLGNTIDVILYDGIFCKGDQIVVGSFDGPQVTKIRALLLPKPMEDTMDPEDKFQYVDTVVAAAGVKIVATGLEKAVAGAPILVANTPAAEKEACRKIKEELSELRFASDTEGVVVKADTLGSLEALVKFLKDQGIPVRISDIGPVSRRDLIEASIVKRSKPEYAAIVGFNIKTTPEAEVEAKDRNIPIFTSNVIYHIVDEFKAWSSKLLEDMRTKEFSQLTLPGEIRILPGCIFRKNSPPIAGIEVLAGTIKPGYNLTKKDLTPIGSIKEIQDSGKNLQEAKRGDKVAVSLKSDITLGRQVQENESLFVALPDNDLFLLKEKYKGQLDEQSLEVIEKIMKIKWKSVGL
ncbi:MAG: translation initiation factor IF-2 [Candidatus Methanomethylicus sp.]|nr:translation initiation factor IF-2 [Candidatus Methanomethylicus sp.]